MLGEVMTTIRVVTKAKTLNSDLNVFSFIEGALRGDPRVVVRQIKLRTRRTLRSIVFFAEQRLSVRKVWLCKLRMMVQKSYIHRPAIKPMDARILAQLYDSNTVLHPKKEAFVIYDDNGQRSAYTFEEVQDKSVKIAATLLLHIGITRGQRVALMAPNCIEFVWSFLALNRIGANVILIPMYGKTEVEVGAIIRRLKCQAFFVFPSGESDYNHKLLAIVGQDINKRKIVNIGPGDDGHYMTNLESLLGTAKLDASYESEVYQRQDKVQFDDSAVVLFTSGSEGEPKAIQYTNHALTNESILQGMYCDDIVASKDPTDNRIFNDRPFSYSACFLVSFNLVFALGCTLITIPPTKSAQEGKTEFILRILQDEKCTHAFLLPYVIRDVLYSQSAKNFELGSLKVITSGGQLIPKEYFSLLQELLPNCALKYMYAMSELVTIANKMFNDQSPDAYDTLNIMPSMEVKIVNQENEIVAVGKKGEICVRSPASFSCYLEDPNAEMRDIHEHGWLHTDDAGYIDLQGGLHVCGRIHEVITKAIDKIYPVEVETVLSRYPDIKAVAVVGVPDNRLNEEICACVIPKAGSELESSVTKFNQWSTSQWKADDLGMTRKPKYTLVFKEFPLTKTGKIDRKSLKAIAKEKLGFN